MDEKYRIETWNRQTDLGILRHPADEYIKREGAGPESGPIRVVLSGKKQLR
jgi:hypothetical protein